MVTSGSSFLQEEVALAVGGGRDRHQLRLTSTTGNTAATFFFRHLRFVLRFFGLGHLLNLGGNVPHCGSCCYGNYNNGGFNNNNGGFNNGGFNNNNGGFNNNNGGFNNNNGGFHNSNGKSAKGFEARMTPRKNILGGQSSGNRCQCEYGLTFRDR